MAFELPTYTLPDFDQSPFTDAPTDVFRKVRQPGVAPEDDHATSAFSEYLHVQPGCWELLRELRMDFVITVERGLRQRGR